jgi:hypothetical protein
MDRLERIGLKNIADLKSYNMSRVGNRLMHLIEFANGGTLEVTLLILDSNSARVEIFKGQKISLQRAGNDLIVGPIPTNSVAPEAGNVTPERNERAAAKRTAATCIRKTAEQISLNQHRQLLEEEARKLEAEASALEHQLP